MVIVQDLLEKYFCVSIINLHLYETMKIKQELIGKRDEKKKKRKEIQINDKMKHSTTPTYSKQGIVVLQSHHRGFLPLDFELTS